MTTTILYGFHAGFQKGFPEIVFWSVFKDSQDEQARLAGPCDCDNNGRDTQTGFPCNHDGYPIIILKECIIPASQLETWNIDFYDASNLLNDNINTINGVTFDDLAPYIQGA